MSKNKKTYLIAIYPDENGCFMAKFPDFPELAADFGKNFDDCIQQSSKFLDAVIADKVDRNLPIPEPTPATKIAEKMEKESGSPICMVPITVYPPAKTVRINLTGKGELFARIDDYAARHHVSRSELMINATLDYIHAN